MLAISPVRTDNCRIALDCDDTMRFDPTSITVSSSCAQITIELGHSSSLPVAAMGHNIVIAASDVWQAVAQDGVKAAGQHYASPNDSRVVAFTPMIGGAVRRTPDAAVLSHPRPRRAAAS